MARRIWVITVLVVLALACWVVPAVALPRGAATIDAPVGLAAAPGVAVTFDASPKRVKFGQIVIVAGHVTEAGQPVSGTTVTLLETRDGVTRERATATTDGKGFYTAILNPRINASWGASAAGATSAQIVVRVAPRVTLALSHVKPRGTRLREIFTGSVRPAHAGRRVLIQKVVRSGWRTVASGRLDSRSRYRIIWAVPYRTATYRLRAVLPASADYARGASPRATLRVVVGRR